MKERGNVEFRLTWVKSMAKYGLIGCVEKTRGFEGKIG